MMDAADYEDRVLSILRGREEWDEGYSTAEFKEHLNEAGLVEEKLTYRGCVMWWANERYEQQQQLDLYHSLEHQHKIITLLKHIFIDTRTFTYRHSLVQFWGVVKVEEHHHYLSTSNYPFSFDKYLTKGVSCYRKLCMDRILMVDVDAAEAEQLGRVERAYRNKHLESTPDLRLYSTNEFPLRDEAARCGFREYMAIPIFDLHAQECYGVLELLSRTAETEMEMRPYTPLSLYKNLEDAELRSTPKSCFNERHTVDIHQRLNNEITNILELAIRTVPLLSLAQVWISCKHCPNISNTNLCCMKMTSFISAHDKIVHSDSCYDEICPDYDISCYLTACKFHNLQLDRTCFLRKVSELSISKYPLAHYANKARLSHCFAICLQSMTNSNDPFVIIQFFLRLKNREDACGDSSLHLLLRIIDMKLKSFKIEQLPEELLVQSRQSNAIESESIDMLNVMDSYKENFLEPDFTTYLETSCCQRPAEDINGGWVFHTPVGEKLIENDSESDLLIVPSKTKEKIEHFMKIIADELCIEYWIIQFWTPKMVEKRHCLETLDQPYAVGCLRKGLASFRKECMKHHYFLDDEAKEEELGPPGRVFRYNHPEFTLNLYHYSTREFCMRNYALHCELEGYFALPIYDKQLHECVGVLEFMGIYDNVDAFNAKRNIEEALMAADLSSFPIDLRPRFRVDDIPANIAKGLTEVKGVFSLIKYIPQLYLAKVWIPDEECANVRYMELALITEHEWKYKHAKEVHWIIYVQPKKGMLGMVLESENKSCFCQNLSEFSIADQPLALVEREERHDVCFAICLQSSHTGELLYVLEFFLIPGLSYLQSFFNLLLPILKQQLPSFKYSSGKQIGEELVVEVIEFPEANNPAFSELGQLDVFPIKFKRVLYGQAEHQQAEDEPVHCVSDSRQTEQGNAVASDFKKTKRGKRETGLHLSLEDIRPHFGKNQKDAAKDIGGTVSLSALKSHCRNCGISRWPYTKKQVGNPSLFQIENREHSQQDMQPSSSRNRRLSETPLHQAEHQQAEDEPVHCVSDARQVTGLHLSLKDLKPHFVKKLKDVAEELGVGRSTIKRLCREYGIDRWPGNEKQARNPFLFERESARNPQQKMPPSSSSSLPQWVMSLHQNVTSTNTESTQHVIDQEEAEKVMVRVKYDKDTIKFELCLSLGVNKLFEEVVRRLNLKTGSFKLKYVDEDNEEILIVCDDDLHLCPKTQTRTGKTCIQLFIPK